MTKEKMGKWEKETEEEGEKPVVVDTPTCVRQIGKECEKAEETQRERQRKKD